ncbi:uncharacterized protein F5Z01DRAFT_682933 [Emericellopsis atlantica]|uniref:Uncharacterized protein n=1 Tax=Emericellopsis atlantica TaxID=2614577 RepID=A0A9P7ZH00_9HYPO|nr:uncharacterized protein F5Z01DRAFT_682933 [Emericellopsis atlantica]KAG9251845.1 hypothetical protein F5Z01DRAFT_682933 [Emericellopsis atlantica]
MATEPTVDSPADAQLASSPSYGGIATPVVNGTANHDGIENKHISQLEDNPNSADASASGGSDNEASKVRDGDKNHGRTASSVKKPATFKAVSVNKTFLASKASTPTSTSKVADRPKGGSSTPPPSGSATLSSRPRLVAKTGSGVGSSGTRSSGLNGSKAPAPDAGAVWNKNKPIPVPDPKKLTDEDLKKYGIHVATRLEEEEDTQGQSKWADLDDDDDDWAPEAITWTDGTKTTLPHTDEPPTPATIPAQPAVPEVKEPAKPKSPAPPSTHAPPKASSGLPSGKGLVLSKAPAEKPTFVAKPTPPQVAKSPWAPLPPVEKASAVAPESAAPASRGYNRDGPPATHHGMSPPSQPLREIAADDFSRSTWRDSGSHGQLYNSQSGRFESAPERRGSLRPDQSKQPAVLQRHAGSEQPAEPSDAFQTSRSSQEGQYGRRRGSSNVSGGSGSFFQRTAGQGSEVQIPPADTNSLRKPSFAGSAEGPLSPALSHGPYRGYRQPGTGYGTRPSPRAHFATPYHGGPPGPTGPGYGQQPMPHAPAPQSEDDVAMQNKLMRESQERARKRKEEEAAEEAARKERIQKKLAALGPAPPSRSERSQATTAPTAVESPKPKHIQQREQPKQPPIPESTSTESQQVGAGAGTESQAAEPSTSGQHNDGQITTAPAGRRPSHGHDNRQQPSWQRSGSGQSRAPPSGPDASTRPERSQNLSWAPGSQASARNVWGSPNNDRGLGNGTFNPDLGLMSDSPLPQAQTGKTPSPIAPPSLSREPSQGQQQPSAVQQSQQAPIGSRPGHPHTRFQQAGAPTVTSKWVSAVAENDRKIAAERLAERVERERQLKERGMTIEDARPAIVDTWRPVNVSEDGRRQQMPPVVETHRHQAGRSWQGAREGQQQPPAARHQVPGPSPVAGVIGSGPGPGNSMIATNHAHAQSKTSRFFPTKEPRGDLMGAPISRPSSPQLPPPTMEGHPAYDGSSAHPLVSLPRPHPVVKLPPSGVAPTRQQSAPKPMSWAQPTPYTPTSYKDAARIGLQTQAQRQQPQVPGGERSNTPWQQRFNNLLGVESSSKNALDHTIPKSSATVSLPGNARFSYESIGKDAASKPMAEECFDEPEMGSLPLVKLPHNAPGDHMWTAAAAPPRNFPKRFLIHATAAESFDFGSEIVNGANSVRISFPGGQSAKFVTVPFGPSRGRGGKTRGRGAYRGKDKKDSASASDTHPPTPTTPSTSASANTERPERGARGRGRGRGTYRGRGSENWHRQSPTQPPMQA